MSFLKSWIRPVFGVLALLVASGIANAQEKPFKIIGAGIGSSGLPLPGQPAREHWAVGTATHLGKYTGLGSVQTDSAVFNPANGHFTGEFGSGVPFAFKAANGDVLACHYGRTDHGAKNPGMFELFPTAQPGVYVAMFLAEFVPYGPDCTGKFKGVKGSWMMFAVSEPFVLGSSDPFGYAWVGEGSLTFKKK